MERELVLLVPLVEGKYHRCYGLGVLLYLMSCCHELYTCICIAADDDSLVN